MEHLTTLDAGFLHAEDADRHVSPAIGGLAVIEGPAPDHDSLMSTFAERIGACPRFAQRLRLHRFDLGAPEWVNHPTSTWPITSGASRSPIPVTIARGFASSPT